MKEKHKRLTRFVPINIKFIPKRNPNTFMIPIRCHFRRNTSVVFRSTTDSFKVMGMYAFCSHHLRVSNTNNQHQQFSLSAALTTSQPFIIQVTREWKFIYNEKLTLWMWSTMLGIVMTVSFLWMKEEWPPSLKLRVIICHSTQCCSTKHNIP